METTLNIDGYTVEISHDGWAEDPRECVSSTLCTAHRRYTFGGERKEHFKRLKRLIRGKVGLQYRPALVI